MSLLVYITVPARTLAMDIAKYIVGKRLGAGVNICGPIMSIYRWQKKIHEREEWMLFVQCEEYLFSEIKNAVQEMHPDIVPCIIGLPVTHGNAEFLHWIATNCGSGECESH